MGESPRSGTPHLSVPVLKMANRNRDTSRLEGLLFFRLSRPELRQNPQPARPLFRFLRLGKPNRDLKDLRSRSPTQHPNDIPCRVILIVHLPNHCEQFFRTLLFEFCPRGGTLLYRSTLFALIHVVWSRHETGPPSFFRNRRHPVRKIMWPAASALTLLFGPRQQWQYAQARVLRIDGDQCARFQFGFHLLQGGYH